VGGSPTFRSADRAFANSKEESCNGSSSNCISGREIVQTRVDFAPGAVAPRHKHPGEEIVYVLAGTLEYRIEGQPTAILKPGDVLFIPYGTVHAVTNVGLDTASELATYVVEKGKPLVVPVK
jgi:quercetin dioxygenase-like cupin family protein